MSENMNDIMGLLETRYKEVVEKDSNTDALVDEKRKQFTSIRNTINQSISKSLKAIDTNHQTVDNHFQKLSDQLKVLFHRRLQTIDEERDTRTHNYGVQKDKETSILAQNELDNKQARDKVKKTFDQSLKEADQAFNDIIAQTEKAIERANKQHSTQMQELIDSTNKHLVNASKIEKEAYDTFNQKHETIEGKRKEALETLKQEKSSAFQQIRKDLQALKKDYKDQLKPLDETIDKLKTKQEKALNKLKETQQKAINKQESYKKEAEKLNDKSNASYHDKKIKQLTKEHAEALEAKINEQKEALDPELKNKDDFIEAYKQKFKTFKQEAIQTILSLVKRGEIIQNDHNIELDKANNVLNKKLAEYDKQTKNIELDRKIQNLNFEFTLDETTAIEEHKQKVAQPEYTLKENEATLNRDIQILELDTSQNIYQKEHDTKIEIMQHNHDFSMNALDNLSTKLNYLYEFDRDTLRHLKQKKHFEIDYQHENMLMSHYKAHSEGYAALKSEVLLNKKPAFYHEIDNRLKLKTNHYKTLIKEAEKEHQKMIETIETTYKQEKSIYEEPLETIRKKHRAIMDAFLANQAKERANIQDQIDELDENKHKKKVLKLKKELSFLKHEQAEDLNDKKMHLEYAKSAYQNMLELIEQKREQSIEEAETLLYHTTDQYNLAIEEAKKAAREEKEALEAHYYEIKHRAKLFNTFQRSRKDETIKKANNYRQKRNQDNDETQAKSEKLLKEQLDKLRTHEANQKQALDDKIQSFETSFEDFKHSTLAEKDQKRSVLKNDYLQEKEKLELQIEKLQSAHEKALETLKNTFEQDKDALFKDKDKNEENYEQRIHELDQSIQKEIENKHETLKETFKQYESNAKQLRSSVENNPFDTLDVDAIASLEESIKQPK